MERDLNRIRQAREDRERAQDVIKADPGVLSDPLAAGTMDLSADAFADPTLLDNLPGMEGANPPGLGLASAEGADANPTDDTTKTNGDTSKSSAAEDPSATQTASTGPADAAADSNGVFDFDSMFGNPSDSNAFDLDFSAPSAANGGTSASGAENMDLLLNLEGAGEDFGDLANAMSGGTESQPADGGGLGGAGAGASADELESLLPGLGSYVNVDGSDVGGGVGDEDFAMIDMPTDGLDLGGQGQGSGAPSQDLNKDSVPANGSNGEVADANAAGDGSGEQNGGQNAGGTGMSDMDDIFGDMLDVGNMGDASIDDFDWNL